MKIPSYIFVLQVPPKGNPRMISSLAVDFWQRIKAANSMNTSKDLKYISYGGKSSNSLVLCIFLMTMYGIHFIDLKKSFCGHKWLAHLFYNKIIPRDVKEPPLENKIQNFIVPYILCKIYTPKEVSHCPHFSPNLFAPKICQYL